MPASATDLIHVVEDDPAVARVIGATLAQFGYRWEHFRSAESFLAALRRTTPKLVILDLGLPDLDGIAVMQQLKPRYAGGVLIVTGRGDTHDRVMGLELGADDYVVKPFEPRELIARARSILRRYPLAGAEPARRQLARFAGWQFDAATHTLTSPAGTSQSLSAAEARLLATLLAHPNQILTRDRLLDGRESATDRSIDLRVSRLRRRFDEDPQHARIIKTVYGAGYLLAATVEWS